MHLELKRADEVAHAKDFLSLLFIKDQNLEELLLFEVVDSWDLIDELGEQVVVDCLCFSKFGPFSVNLLTEDGK